MAQAHFNNVYVLFSPGPTVRFGASELERNEQTLLKWAICNHTFPVYLISTSLIPAKTADMHTDIENEDFCP